MLKLPQQCLLVCLLTLAASLPALADPGPTDDCPATNISPVSLPRVRQVLHNNSELTIVAFGSSSTQGWHATSIAQSYPAVLQAELSAALPGAHVAVINRGIGGQDAAEMVPRIGTDVLGVHPSLVIWQVGANGAMKDRDPDAFYRLVIGGVHTLQDAGVDVVLMDNQRAPVILAAPHHAEIERAVAVASARTGAGLFSRGALMDNWQSAGHPYTEFMSEDGIHHNDRGYRCVAKALASAIVKGLDQPSLPIHSVSASVRR